MSENEATRLRQRAATILFHARETLTDARAGLDDARKGPQTRIAGVRNAVVSGRAMTSVLENLRSVVPEFDAWYRPVAAALEADPLVRYFWFEAYYIELQPDIATSGLAIPNAPPKPAGQPADIVELCERYLDRMAAVLVEAEAQFGRVD